MIAVRNLSIAAGSFCLEGLSFAVPTGRSAILIGKTGTGKTTLLEAICGLKPVRAGAIELMGREVQREKPAERGIGYVPQDLALFRTMTVGEQLALALVIRHWPRSRIDERVRQLAQMLGIERLLDRRTRGLSGGEAQRVALGRALAYRPSVLLLDEPLSALDEQTREEMYELLRSVQRQAAITTLHVTHNLSEARHLADQLLVLRDGQIVEEPLELLSADNATAIYGSASARPVRAEPRREVFR